MCPESPSMDALARPPPLRRAMPRGRQAGVLRHDGTDLNSSASVCHVHPQRCYLRTRGTRKAQQAPTCPVGLECVPHVAVEVIVPCEEEASTLGERHRGDPANDVVMGVSHELLVCTKVEQPAGGIIRASGKCIAIWKELESKRKRVCECTKRSIGNRTAQQQGCHWHRRESSAGAGLWQTQSRSSSYRHTRT